MAEPQTIIYMSDGAEYGSVRAIDDLLSQLNRILVRADVSASMLLPIELALDDGVVWINPTQVTAVRPSEA